MEISDSHSIKNLGTTDQLSTVTMPTTAFASLKTDKSTIKQSIDSTRTRNHWTASGTYGLGKKYWDVIYRYIYIIIFSKISKISLL